MKSLMFFCLALICVEMIYTFPGMAIPLFGLCLVCLWYGLKSSFRAVFSDPAPPDTHPSDRTDTPKLYGPDGRPVPTDDDPFTS